MSRQELHVPGHTLLKRVCISLELADSTPEGRKLTYGHLEM